MGKRLPKPGELIMTANRVSGYEDAEPITNQLAVVRYVKADHFNGQTIKATLLTEGFDVVLFEHEYSYPDDEHEYSYPDEEKFDAGG